MLTVAATMITNPEDALAKLKQDLGPAEIARRLGISSQAVSQWKKAPPAWCIQLEEKTGVSRHELRPDIFGEAA